MPLTEGTNNAPLDGAGTKLAGVADASATSANLWLPRSLAAGDALALKYVQGVGLYLYDGATGVRAVQANPAGGGALGTAGILAAAQEIWDTTNATYRAARAAAGVGDANAGAGTATVAPFAFNEATFDRLRNNTAATVLASAARTVATSTGTLTNHNGRGVHVEIQATAKAGATTLTVRLLDSLGSGVVVAGPAFAAAVGTVYTLQLYPGVVAADYAAPNTGRAVVVPRTYVLQVVPSDASSVTYAMTCLTVL